MYFGKLPALKRETLTQLRTESSQPSEVVVKISSGNDPNSIAYLEKEISVLNQIDSLYYPRLYHHELIADHPETDERLLEKLFVTIEEKIDAVPLSERTSLFTSEKPVVRLLRELVEGLSVLWTHESKLVHRDLKPDNILVGPKNEVYIIDLGILRETGAAGVTSTGAPWGPLTAKYTCPEQAKNDKKNISFKSDCFALGTIAYELIAGSNPYVINDDASFPGVLRMVIEHNPPPLNTISSCSENFGRVLCKMMEKEPYRRHRTIDLLRQDLIDLERENT